MATTPKWRRYLRFWSVNTAADVDDELAFHVDARTQELCDSGLDRVTARTRALKEFGDMEGTRRLLRTMDERHAAIERRASFAADLSRDVRVAIRALARTPGLVVVVAMTFALGIGVTSAIYSVVDAYLFRPLPGTHTADLVVLGRTDNDIALPHELSYPDFRDYRADTAVFASLAAYTTRTVELNTDRGTERLWVDDVTANFFSVLGRDVDPSGDHVTQVRGLTALAPDHRLDALRPAPSRLGPQPRHRGRSELDNSHGRLRRCAGLVGLVHVLGFDAGHSHSLPGFLVDEGSSYARSSAMPQSCKPTYSGIQLFALQ